MLLQAANRLVQIGGLKDAVAHHVQTAPDQAPRECRRFGDQDPPAVRRPARGLEPIFGGRSNDLVEIEEIRDMLAHHGRPEEAFAARPLPHGDCLFGDIQNLVDHHTHAAVAIVEDDHLDRIGCLVVVGRTRFEYGPERDQREYAVPVLHYLTAAGVLDR